ncbi:MAG: glycosyltransferase family 1 protein [Patescibacteria group bacterium]
MKKLLIITDVWHPQVNGVLIIFNNLIRILEKNGFEIKIIHPGMFKNFPFPLYPEIKIPLATQSKVYAMIHKENPDYIHILTEGVLGFQARSVCKKNKLKFTTSFHTEFALYLPLYLGLNIKLISKIVYEYLRWFHGAAVNVTVPTNSLKIKLEKLGFKNLSICPNGVDLDLFRIRSEDVLLQFPRPIFLYLGRLAVEKNIEEFLKCSLTGTKVVVGDGPLRKTLEQRYKNTATFLGYKKGEELAGILSSADVLVFPSHTDTFGLTIIEALACGVPVAAHAVTGPIDIISDGVDGILDENLEKAAFQCLSLSRNACRSKALQYSWDIVTQKFMEVLSHAKL